MFEEIATQELEDELCSQATLVSVSECRLVLLIGEFDRREAWGAPGLKSCAHWLNWRVGTSLGAAREQVRVGRALADLPQVREAFESGELSFSKVRAITRVATPELEASLIELARHATAAQLEQIVREYRRADPDERERAATARDRRYVTNYVDDDGMLVIRARLSPEEGASFLAAIEVAREALLEAGDVSAETFSEVTTADALAAACASVVARGLSEEMENPNVSVIVHVDERVLEDPTQEGCAHVEGVGAITAHAAARLACDGAVSRIVFGSDGTVEPRGKTRTVPSRMRRALLVRDRGCRFPGCGTRRFLHAHHVVYWSRGGPTKMSNLLTVCGRHHRLIHDQGWTVRLEKGRVSVFDAAGLEVPAIRPPAPLPVVDPDPPNGLLAYGGESYDLGLTIDALLCVAGKT